MSLNLENQQRLHKIIGILLEQKELQTGPEGHIRIPLKALANVGITDIDQIHSLVGYLEKVTDSAITDEFYPLLQRAKTDPLQFALLSESLKANLIVKIPVPDRLLQFQKKLMAVGALDDQPEQLTWVERDRIVSWGKYGQHIIPNTRHALILFLNVFWPHAGTGSLNNQSLAMEYDSHCESMRRRYKENEEIPQYLRTQYQSLSSKNIGKKVDRCIKELRNIFAVPPGRYFPIENQGSLDNAAWVWHKINPTKPKHSFD